jgi:hypothetical protein
LGNPWNEIELDVYERHMQSDGVLQLQTLSRITAEQLGYQKPSVAFLGAAGGNGLEHIDPCIVSKVYAIDISKAYLDVCKQRYSHLGAALETLQCDLAEPGLMLPPAELLICNLIIEYVGLGNFTELIRSNADRVGVVSCVIQKNNGNGFVSRSSTAQSLDCLQNFHQDIDERDLTQALAGIGFTLRLRRVYPLPNAKKFIRLDFTAQ